MEIINYDDSPGQMVLPRSRKCSADLTLRNAAERIAQSDASLRFLFGLLIGLTLNALISPDATAASHIEVTREVLLESGQPAKPIALARTQEGGYIVAGSITDSTPWATRTDSEGNVQWRYVAPMEQWNPDMPLPQARYESAVTLLDDSTLLCGLKNLKDNSIAGLLTHIDKTGKVLSERLVYPHGDQSYQLNYLHKCLPWGAGVAVMGTADRYSGTTVPRHHESFLWLLKLDANGIIKWEKLIPNLGVLQALAMSNDDLVFTTGLTDVIRLDPNGAIKAQRTIPFAMFVPSSTPPPVLQVLVGGKDKRQAWHTLGEHLEDTRIEEVGGHTEFIPFKKIYQLPDHSLALFGDTTPPQYGGMLIASIAWLSPDLKQRETFSFKPWSPWVADALPTGKEGEFVTVRQVLPFPERAPVEKRFGAVLSFVRIK